VGAEPSEAKVADQTGIEPVRRARRAKPTCL